jgi:uncharacterized membrane protein YwzB
MIEYVLYVSSLFIVFYINLRILHAIRIEQKFEKMKLWEIRAAYFMISIAIAHLISDMLLRLTKIIELI